MIVDECEVPPVVEKVSVIEPYAVPAVVEYLHVAFSSVVKDKATCVVPADWLPEGEPAERTGVVESLSEQETATLVIFALATVPEPFDTVQV